jgi:hypothetical protein
MRSLVGVVVLVTLAGCQADGSPDAALWKAAAEGFARGFYGTEASNRPVRSSYEVTCVTRDSSDPGQRIDGLGGPFFRQTIDNVISAVEGGTRLYTKVQGRDADLIVAEQAYPRLKYLRTTADGYAANNLLSLPDCS